MPVDLLVDAFLRYSRIQALDEIRTRRILREKADCKQSKSSVIIASFTVINALYGVLPVTRM